MKIKYTPGTKDGLVGKTFTVEVISIELREVPHIDNPLLTFVKIKYNNGKTEWVSGAKLFNSTDMIQKKIIKRSY